MEAALKVNGRDIDIGMLVPLNERDIKLETHAGFRKIVASIKAIGLIEPLSVFQENSHYVILDGFLRYKACQALDIETIPCMVYDDKQGYVFNRNVNRLSAFQEIRMLRKAMEKIDEPTIAQAFGMKSIRYRLAPNLMKQLHPDVVVAFKENVIGKVCAKALLDVTHPRQAEIMQEMKEAGDYSPSFCRTLVLRTPASQRTNRRKLVKSWAEDDDKKKDMVKRLEHAEKQHDFYVNLYQQYATDLMKLMFYARKLITCPKVEKYLSDKHEDILSRFKEVVFENNGKL